MSVANSLTDSFLMSACVWMQRCKALYIVLMDGRTSSMRRTSVSGSTVLL